jgi:hypothetical protein
MVGIATWIIGKSLKCLCSGRSIQDWKGKRARIEEENT